MFYRKSNMYSTLILDRSINKSYKKLSYTDLVIQVMLQQEWDTDMETCWAWATSLILFGMPLEGCKKTLIKKKSFNVLYAFLNANGNVYCRFLFLFCNICTSISWIITIKILCGCCTGKRAPWHANGQSKQALNLNLDINLQLSFQHDPSFYIIVTEGEVKVLFVHTHVCTSENLNG